MTKTLEDYKREAARIATVAENRGCRSAAALILRTRRTYGDRAALVCGLVMRELILRGKAPLVGVLCDHLALTARTRHAETGPV